MAGNCELQNMRLSVTGTKLRGVAETHVCGGMVPRANGVGPVKGRLVLQQSTLSSDCLTGANKLLVRVVPMESRKVTNSSAKLARPTMVFVKLAPLYPFKATNHSRCYATCRRRLTHNSCINSRRGGLMVDSDLRWLTKKSLGACNGYVDKIIGYC